MEMLGAIHGCAKIKMHASGTSPISVLEGPVFYIVIVVMLPFTMADMWLEGKSWHYIHEQVAYSPPNVYFCTMVVVLSVVFTGIRLFIVETADPFGTDHSDIQLPNFQTSLHYELNMILANAEARLHDSDIVQQLVLSTSTENFVPVRACISFET